MIVKMHSMMLGYKEFSGKVENHGGKPVLIVDSIGYISPLEFIRQGCSLKLATDSEIRALKQGGYKFRD